MDIFCMLKTVSLNNIFSNKKIQLFLNNFLIQMDNFYIRLTGPQNKIHQRKLSNPIIKNQYNFCINLNIFSI